MSGKIGIAAAAVLVGILSCAPASAGEAVLFVKAGTYDDVRFDLTNAIVERGLKIDYNGKTADMLARTGADIGSTKPIYKAAEFFSFCSAKLSRTMMEADPANLGACPYIVFIYETVAKPGEVVVGYRKPTPRGNAASKASLAEVGQLLEGIAKDATK